MSTLSFRQHKEKTADDCEAIAESIKGLAAQVREGNMGAFETFWIEGGTEEGDAKICAIRELVVLRYHVWAENVQGSEVENVSNECGDTKEQKI